ncbi:hypothetical protein ACWDKQ_25965 [Saccharopolyspora sp. NPDC000995]
MNELAERARSWFHDTYGQRATLKGEEAILSAEQAAFFACPYVESGEPMLAEMICVPLDGKAGVMPPPEPAQTAWFGPMVAPLGPVVGVSVHEHWFGVLEEIASFPAQTQVLCGCGGEIPGAGRVSGGCERY